MFGLTDIKKINERAAAKAVEEYSGNYYAKGDAVFRGPVRNPETRGISLGFCVCTLAPGVSLDGAKEIADALNLADAFKEAQANAVGRT